MYMTQGDNLRRKQGLRSDVGVDRQYTAVGCSLYLQVMANPRKVSALFRSKRQASASNESIGAGCSGRIVAGNGAFEVE